MKNLLIALSLLLAATAHAAEIKIEEFSQYQLYGFSTVSQKFDVNMELGRAWVEFTVNSGDPESVPDTYRVKVEGLSYKNSTEEIVFNLDGQEVVCATYKIKGPRFFNNRVVKMNGNCSFEGRWRDITYDNGFEIKKTSKYEVFLIVE